MNLAPQLTYTTHITNAKPEDGRDYWESWLEKAKTDKKAAALVQMYQHRPAQELYDLESDPYELTNLAANPENKQVLASFENNMVQWMEGQNDQEGLTLYFTNIKYKNRNEQASSKD